MLCSVNIVPIPDELGVQFQIEFEWARWVNYRDSRDSIIDPD